MKAVRAAIVAEQTVEFETFKVPKTPKKAQVLIRVERTIISAGTELANYTGLDTDTRVKGAWCAYPWIPGYGGVGTVVAVGPEVENFKPGQRVYGFFKHASYALIDTAREMLVHMPADLDPTEAVMARMCGVAISAYQRARVTLGDTVVIIGLGLVGNLAGQFFAQAGQRVIGLDVSAHRRALAGQTGFDATLDPAGLSDKKLLARILELSGKVRPRVVVDAVGDSRLVERAVHLVADNGQVIMLGTPRAAYHSNTTDLLKPAHFRGVEIVGALEWLIPLLKRQGRGVSTEANTELIFRMIGQGALKVMPLCSHVLPASDLDTAYQGLLHQKDAYLGVVLDWENYPTPEPGQALQQLSQPQKAAGNGAALAPRRSRRLLPAGK